MYNIGIDVRQGRGLFRDTHIITFAPRYEIDNRSRHKLAISQRHLAMGKVCHSRVITLNNLTILPQKSIVWDKWMLWDHTICGADIYTWYYSTFQTPKV